MKFKLLTFAPWILILFFATSSICFSEYQSVIAQKNSDDDDDEDEDEKEKKIEKLVVKATIDLKNIDMDNTNFLRLIGFINGEEVKQDIPISSIDKTKGKLKVDLKVNEENDIVEADSPDEFFVCAYQVGDVVKNYNSFAPFDCNEGDILGNPTQISLFKSGSHVYEKSQAVYGANVNNTGLGSNNDKVRIKIIAPLSDKKDTDKLVIAAMIKGQIQSQVIDDVQAELDKSDSSTIQRTFTFDRKTDIGLIQIGDRYHACVASEDLRPPEGSECEKRVIKHLDKANSLPAR
ncbi:MAG TPA: hypothetical protein VJ697_10570 [Nitrososphaeraceae archaeon]|nr:hypothetical protein [Nitrososphaeraceae archaeon]